MIRQVLFAAVTAGAMTMAPLSATAAGLFSPVIHVGDQVVTRFELDQRRALLEVLNTAGDLDKLAREQLIDDRLKLTAARGFGVTVSEAAVDSGLKEFASRGNLSPEDFLKLLGQEGIDPETVRAYIRVGLIWRDVVGGLFSARVSVSESDIDKAMDALGNRAALQVLLSEVIIPLQPGYEEQISKIADQVALIEDFKSFEEAAARYSAAPTKENGGKLNWLPITRLPANLRPVLLGLNPGETTNVIPMQGALAVFQMRSIAETAYRAPTVAAIEYAALYLPGGQSAETQAQATALRGRVDTCDDLYGENYGKDPALLDRISLAPKDLPRDIALELAKLDENEVSTALTRNEGQDLVFLMMCGRTPQLGTDTSREEVSVQLRNQQLDGFANGYLEELRAETRIVSK